MNGIQVSVVIPAYNAEDTLAGTLDSVHAQTRPANEIIVIDDGSEDRTAEIATGHISGPRVISTSNHGSAAALNHGIEEASCTILAFVDADDIWTENKLELQTGFLSMQPDTGFILSHMEAFVCPSVSEETRNSLVFPAGPQPGYLIGTMMARRDVFRKHGMFDTELRTGYFIDWFSRMKSRSVQYTMLDEILLKRRVRPGTLGQRSNASDQISSDFVEIARRAIARKRNNRSGIP